MNNFNFKNNETIKNIRYFIGELDTPARYLLISGIMLAVSFAAVIIFLLPSAYNLRNASNAVNIEKGNLDYIIKYAEKINAARASNADGSSGAASMPAANNKKSGYINSVYSMLNYLKINKNDIEKLTGSYSKKEPGGQNGVNGQNPAKEREDVSIVLRGLSLNELVDVIYGLSASGYRVKFTSIKIHKNFDDEKLLDLNITLKRKINGNIKK